MDLAYSEASSDLQHRDGELPTPVELPGRAPMDAEDSGSLSEAHRGAGRWIDPTQIDWTAKVRMSSHGYAPYANRRAFARISAYREA